ncbi:COG1835 Predicted acyltransferases [Candidatus Pelagibacterales bacterium]
MKKINHDNHIQALRALAVIAVVLFHSKPDFFFTGYLGVDIFFVISGYLICKVLLKEKKFNKFKLVNFYIRRARRTLPALIILVFFILPFFIKSLLPVNLNDFAQSLIVTPIFLSNFLFGSENTYWGTISELKPLLHTWSLSIEWQFYIFFPLLFFLRKKIIIFIIFIIFIISLIINNFINLNNINIYISDHKIRFDNFFFTTNRIWEFLSGSLLAYINNKHRKKYNEFFSYFGLLLILLSFIFFTKTMRDNATFNIIPVIGSCLFIYFTNKRDFFYKIYTNKIFLHIGLISYSLYLWHQPILAYFKNLLNNNIPNHFYILIFFLIYFFSRISFLLIERTFYEKNFLSRKNFIIFIILSISIIISIGFYLTKTRVDNSIIKKIENIKAKYPNLDIVMAAQTIESEKSKLSNIKFNTENSKIKIYIWGDSHARDLFLILTSNLALSKRYEFSMNDFDNSNVLLITRQFYEGNLDLKKYDIINKAQKENKKVIVIGRAAEFYAGNIDPLLFVVMQDNNAYENNNTNIIDNNFYRMLRDDIIKINFKLKKNTENIGGLYIDRVNLGCELKKNKCFGMTNDKFPIYSDPSHLTAKGVDFFNKQIDNVDWFDPVFKFINK